jgi:outer membrane protein OmpA-like peptidoglycan-associated protein
MRRRWIAALVLAGMGASIGRLAAQSKDPDSPDVQAAAKAALPRAKVLDIVGVTSGIQGLLKDLNAKVSDREVRIELSTDVLFDFDSYALRAEASATLRKVATVLKDYGKSPVVIEGHTDGKGADAYNQTLSERRADSVKRWLVDPGGVEAARISTRGWGKTKPVAANTKPDGADDPEGRQKNRRVEITVKRQS